MIALLDCNNFYVSCERLFNPNLLDRPVVVLSNNDGCVISRSDEVKKIGIKMGEPFFKIKDLVHKFGITVKSSNYSLYGDISNRIMSILKNNCSNVDVYSIDEAFFSLDKVKKKELFCYNLFKKILKWTGIPVSIGIAETKTLSKLINRVIKKKGEYLDLESRYENVLEIICKNKLNYVLWNTNVEDIWGVGQGLSTFLKENNIENALQLSGSNEYFARQKKGIILQKIILELRGISCYKLENSLSNKSSIRISRSFGKKLYSYEDIRDALIIYVQKAAAKLRNYKLFCKSISVFLRTSEYEEKKYKKILTYKLSEATIDLRIIWKISDDLLKNLYKRSFSYSKVGVVLSDLVKNSEVQRSFLFNDKYYKYRKDKDLGIKLMGLIDEINIKFGEGKLRLSSDRNGFFYLTNTTKYKKKKNWLMKSDYRSPCYTTNWCDIPKIKV